MAEVTLINSGILKNSKNWISASSSVTLIKSDNKNIIVDTGGKGWTQKILKNLILRGKIKPENIKYVINTHCHLDHIWNNFLFKKAIFISAHGKLIGSTFFWHSLPLSLNENIKIIPTPGHSADSCSVIVNTTKGSIAIVGDLFLKDKIEKTPPLTQNIKLLKYNRNRILKIADIVIPGHGEAFNTKG